ncbi:hypothetical protein MYCTH_2309397 [Thermothelomyces thermophilus ATCC 42464]|uniref:Uncharacterized protein n=1 Tax=Thermothelomyces thermophilus (strain ATCC 42464 / BCRC 31852 / DSM 1799) TaxID=573729 RepID=G2QI93_THET4|nr:uncharacterized protein MYCTH_2309397 [Thermothelomyces thermophilus ATCC 42464]AEO60282.1 hypothetical protein MYCTH_2309397 [Thermothelomyces thermophilus ATCC 42464]
MALPPASTVDSLKFFEENGYFSDDCAAIGRLVIDQETKGNVESSETLNLAKSILLHERCGAILEPYLNCPNNIELCVALGPDKNHCFVFTLQSGETDRIIIHMWSPRSQGELYRGSHVDLPGQRALIAAPASNGLLEPPSAILRMRENNPITVTMANGGITITDRRFVFRILQGSTISFDLRKEKNPSEVAGKKKNPSDVAEFTLANMDSMVMGGRSAPDDGDRS